jgi:hypothetical protein
MKLKHISALFCLIIFAAGLANAATVNGLQYAKTVAVPAQLVTQGFDGGRVRVCKDSYALSADLSSGDIIRLCRIPAGATVINVKLIFPALSAGTLNVGFGSSADAVETGSSTAFISGVNVTSAGVYDVFTSNSTAAGLKTFSSQVTVQAAVAVDTTATSGTVKVEVYYVID